MKICVKDFMKHQAQYIFSDKSIRYAAEIMRDFNCGFLPITDAANNKLLGVITDRDIVVRAASDDTPLKNIPVSEIKTPSVLYCFENDDVDIAARKMGHEGVYRLVVLNNPDDRKLAGIITLGDILRGKQTVIATQAAEEIASKAA